MSGSDKLFKHLVGSKHVPAATFDTMTPTEGEAILALPEPAMFDLPPSQPTEVEYSDMQEMLMGITTDCNLVTQEAARSEDARVKRGVGRGALLTKLSDLQGILALETQATTVMKTDSDADTKISEKAEPKACSD